MVHFKRDDMTHHRVFMYSDELGDFRGAVVQRLEYDDFSYTYIDRENDARETVGGFTSEEEAKDQLRLRYVSQFVRETW